MFDVGILTWYKSLNHGAILQAYASQQFLKENNISNILLDYDRSSVTMETNREKIKRKISYLNINYLKMRIQLKKWNSEKKFKFNNFMNEHMNIGRKYNVYNKINNVMIGSDMVFDFYEGYNPFMYGKDVKSKNIFSYAACFGYTTNKSFEKFDKKDEIVKYIRQMKAIGYRDDNTFKILKNNCGIKNAIKNIDPVLLYGFNREKAQWNSKGWKNKDYILIYSYQSNLDKKYETRSIRRFAKENNLKIVSVGYYHAWCDENINADPMEFVEMFNNAKYVITDTFHGLVFSIIMNKQFSLIVRNNSFKVLDLLNELNIVYNTNESLDEKLIKMKNNNINYNEINRTLKRLREESSKYLIEQIEK